MHKNSCFRALAILAFLCAIVPGASAQKKKRVAVLNFEYATVQTQVAAVFGATGQATQDVPQLDTLVLETQLLAQS